MKLKVGHQHLCGQCFTCLHSRNWYLPILLVSVLKISEINSATDFLFRLELRSCYNGHISSIISLFPVEFRSAQ